MNTDPYTISTIELELESHGRRTFRVWELTAIYRGLVSELFYAGRRPLEVMIEGGIPSLLLVRRHVDALRGGL